MEKATIKVSGMTCGGCVAGVERALRQRPGVSAAKASLADANVTVEFDGAQIQKAALEDAIRKAGFGVG